MDADLEEVVVSLLESANDRDEAVNEAVQKSLCELAANPANVDTCLIVFSQFLDSQVKITPSHAANVLCAIEKICMRSAQSASPEASSALADSLVARMTSGEECAPAVQMPASGALVALGRHHCEAVAGKLVELLKTGVPPHYAVPHTLGALALVNFEELRPFVKNILSKMVPVLGMLRAERIRQSFSYAMTNFSTGLIDLRESNIASDDAKTDENAQEDNLSTEFSIVFDVLFSQWLHSSEGSVVENVLQAIGPMINLISIEKRSELAPKLIPTVISIYRRANVDPVYVTQALFYILSKATTEQSNLLSPSTVESVNNALFSHVISLPDYDQSQKIKNHFETLRCFDVLLKNASSGTLEYLLNKCKSNYDEDKMRAIVVITHLVVSLDANDISDNFKAILKENVASEGSVKMKQILLKGIVAVTYKKAPVESDSILLEFIINHIPSRELEDSKDRAESEGFRKDCESSLYLLTTTVTHARDILWPLLLRALLSSKSNVSTSILTKCLAQLIRLDDEADPIPNGSEAQKPSNEALFIRCMSVLNYPDKDRMFHDVVHFLSKYCEFIHKDLGVTWELELKHLTSYLDSEQFSFLTWESMLLEAFRSAIYMVNDVVWINGITQSISEQIHQTDRIVTQRGILYKFLAILSCNMIDNNNVENKLDILFNAFPSCVSGEEVYLARSLGIASIKHGIYIIDKLDDMSKAVDSKKITRFLKFSFIKHPKQELSVNTMRYSITLCYNEIAKEVLDANILAKLIKTDKEGHGTCVRWILNVLQNGASPMNLVESALTTLYHLAKAIDTVSHNMILNERWQLLNLALDHISEGDKRLELEHYPIVIKSIASLTKLPNYLTPEERNAVLKILYVKLFNAIAAKCDPHQETDDHVSEVLDNIRSSLELIIVDFMLQSCCPSTLDDMLGSLEEWIVDKCTQVRIAATKSFHCTLNAFLKNVKLTYENPSRFGQSGYLLGRVVPRCTDDSVTVRQSAVDCVKILVQIIDLYEGHAIDSECEKKFSICSKQALSEDPRELVQAITTLGHVIANKIQHQQVLLLVESLLSGYQVSAKASALGADIVLKIIFQTKGQDLYQNAEDVMDYILGTLPHLQGTAKECLLETMLTFAQYHPKNVVQHLLVQPLPFEECINECWSVLSQNAAISTLTLDTFLSILDSDCLFEEMPKYENDRIASVQCLAAICAMREMLSQPNVKAMCEERFAAVFSTLYVTMVSFSGVSPPAHSIPTNKRHEKFGFVPNFQSTKMCPLKIVVETIKALLINSGCPKLIDVLLACGEQETSTFLSGFLDIVGSIVKIFCEDYPWHLAKLVTSLNQFSRSSLIPRRIAVVAFFSHLVAFRCNDNHVMLETVMSELHAGWKDTASEIRAISLSGLSNIKYLKREQRDPLVQSVVSSLYHGLDDNQGSTPRTNVPLVAMVNLTEFLLLDTIVAKGGEHMDAYAKIALRIKPFMNVDDPALREASVRLFGEIALAQNCESLKEQSYGLLPCFLLHLADEDANVIKACKQTLRKISPLMIAPKTNSMIQNHLIDGAKLHIADFLTDLVKCVAAELPQNVPQLIDNTYYYMNSPWDGIRANAVIMIGLLFSNLNRENAADNEYEKTRKSITARLLQLLKDKTTVVRISAARAIGGLY